MYTVNWSKEQGIYGGGFSEEDSKWLAAGGGKYSAHPWEATPMQQIAIFHKSGRRGEWTYGNWPTIAGCEGLPGSRIG